MPTRPLSTSPLPPVARPGLPAATVSGVRRRGRDHRRDALEQHRGAALLRRGHGRRPRIELAYGESAGNSARNSPGCGVRTSGRPSASGAQLLGPALKGDEPVRVQHDRLGRADQRRHQGPASGLAAQPGADHDGVRARDQVEQRLAGRLAERDGRRSGDRARPASARRPSRAAPPRAPVPPPRANAARPAMRTAPLMPASPPTMTTRPRSPLWSRLRSRRSHCAACGSVTSDGHAGVGRRMPDVDHHDGAHLVPREQVAAPDTAERDGQRRARSAVHDAGLEINAGRPVDRDDRQLEVENALHQRGHRRTRRAPRSGAEERVHHEADARPGPVGRDLAHAVGARACGHASRSSAAGPGGAVTHTGTSRRWRARATTHPSPPLWPGPAATSTPSRSRWA